MGKFRLKKFMKDREKSTENSRKGDYKLLEALDGRNNLSEAIQQIRIKLDRKECPHDTVGCDLPRIKRTLSNCETCPIR